MIKEYRDKMACLHVQNGNGLNWVYRKEIKVEIGKKVKWPGAIAVAPGLFVL